MLLIPQEQLERQQQLQNFLDHITYEATLKPIQTQIDKTRRLVSSGSEEGS